MMVEIPVGGSERIASGLREACAKSLVGSSSTRDLFSGLGVASKVHRTWEKLCVGEMGLAK